MPYIKKKEQERLAKALDQVNLGSKGELTFCINFLQMKFCEQRFKTEERQKVDYQMVSDARAAAIDASFEWQDRVVRKYEDHKMRENGDVFQEFIRKANI